MHIQQQGVTSVSQLNKTGPGAASTAKPDPNPPTNPSGRRAEMHPTDPASSPTDYQQDKALGLSFLKLPKFAADAKVSNTALGMFVRLINSHTNPASFGVMEALSQAHHWDDYQQPISTYLAALAELVDSDLLRLDVDGTYTIPESWSYDGGLTMWGAA
jgi:hypothetical protein